MGTSSGATNRLNLMNKLVELLLVYTSFADFLSIIPFGEEVKPIIPGQLVTSSKSTKAYLLSTIKNLQARGHSNPSDAFEKAFSLLKSSGAVGQSSGCQKVGCHFVSSGVAYHIIIVKCLIYTTVIVFHR